MIVIGKPAGIDPETHLPIVKAEKVIVAKIYWIQPLEKQKP